MSGRGWKDGNDEIGSRAALCIGHSVTFQDNTGVQVCFCRGAEGSRTIRGSELRK